MSEHVTEAKYLQLEVNTTTLSPSILHHDVSTHDWGKVSTAGALYYYIESHYLTHEVSTHPWGQGSTARGRSELLHWVPVSDTKLSVHMTEAKFLLLEVCTTTLSLSIWHLKSVHITVAKFLQLEVNTTTCTLSPSTWGQVSTARG